MSALMCMQEVCKKCWEHCESQRAFTYPSSSDMWLSWKEGERHYVFDGSECFIWFFVSVCLLLDCAIRQLKICVPFLFSVGRHKFVYAPDPPNSIYGHQARDSFGSSLWWQPATLSISTLTIQPFNSFFHHSPSAHTRTVWWEARWFSWIQ